MWRWLLASFATVGACSSYEDGEPRRVASADAGSDASPIDAGPDAPPVLVCTDLYSDPLSAVPSGWSRLELNGGAVAPADGGLRATAFAAGGSNGTSIATIERVVTPPSTEVHLAFDVHVRDLRAVAVPGCSLRLLESASKSSLGVGLGLVSPDQGYIATSAFVLDGKLESIGDIVPVTRLAANNWSRVELVLRTENGQVTRTVIVDGNVALFPPTEGRGLVFDAVQVTCGVTVVATNGQLTDARGDVEVRNLVIRGCNAP